MIDSFGARLRRHRERQQITLVDVAARTKIKASLFDELERDDVSRWPAGIFRRSFVRAYAQTVGLDPEQLVRDFLEHFPDGERSAVEPPVENPFSSASATETLRLTLADTGGPFRSGRFLADTRRRWSAVGWDLGTLIGIAVTAFLTTHRFWMPLGIVALCYYLGGILVLGNTPGVWLFAPGLPDEMPGEAPVSPYRGRPRAVDRASRYVPRQVNPFKSVRRSGATRT
jgi:transcriptional regulator with XRE-family HTH domain